MTPCLFASLALTHGWPTCIQDHRDNKHGAWAGAWSISWPDQHGDIGERPTQILAPAADMLNMDEQLT
jgi:hypothetical protein